MVLGLVLIFDNSVDNFADNTVVVAVVKVAAQLEDGSCIVVVEVAGADTGLADLNGSCSDIVVAAAVALKLR